MNQHGDHKVPRRSRLPAAERRETILRAAAEVFASAGYRAGKVSDVAARVGVTEPVIFQNFGSKAALFAAVMERAVAEARASLNELAAGFGSASGLLAHVLAGSGHDRPGQDVGHSAAGHATAGHPGALWGMLFADATALTGEPEVTGAARDGVLAVARHLADLIERAQTEQGVRADVDPDAAAWLLLSVLTARRLRAAVMPASLEADVAALALQVLAPPAAATRSRHPRPRPAPPGRPALTD